MISDTTKVRTKEKHQKKRKELNPDADFMSLQHPQTVAGLADRNELRKRIRALGPFQGQRDRRALEELARQLDVATVPPSTSLLLARALWKVGAPKKCLEVLYAAQQRYPADVSLNAELGSRLLPLRGEVRESIGFLRAALAVRPKSSGLQARLGDRL